ncbi:hypothetical protein H5410_039627 [Solanum commersonii]|uniref:TF-B3 domain-containing protein n=1 Tax=Solanum commersonii TaxID=4109 RepID=A0A9J5XLH6_SOLCO|nr:hypothetical protein H5410_039627 [Solanum commersonii]
MILTDEKQRSWPVQLSQRVDRFVITKGFEKFMKANGVQAGDTYKFELIDNRTLRVECISLKIPIGFLKYLKGYEHIKRAVLKRGGKKWRIKLNEHRFEEGNWGKFVEENDLQLGDLLVFRHEGNMEFEVSVFDSSHCDREYSEYLQEEGGGRARTVEEISKEFEFKGILMHATFQLEAYGITGLGIETSDMPAPKAQVPAPTSANTYPHFIATIKSYTISWSYLCLPMAFIKSTGLMDRRKMILTDEKQRSWPVQLSQRVDRFVITKGFEKFMTANGVQVGDTYKFELIDNRTLRVECKYAVKDEKHERNHKEH